LQAGKPRGTVLWDAAYGDDCDLRDWLTENQLIYALGVRPGTPVWWGEQQPLRSRFARVCVRAAHRDVPRAEEWLVIEWPKDETEASRYWLSTHRKDMSFAELVESSKARWWIECDYQELKQEFGLGHYEGRNWRGFHHHASRCIAAYGFLMRERLSGRKKRRSIQETCPTRRFPPVRGRDRCNATCRIRSPRCACAWRTRLHTDCDDAGIAGARQAGL